MGTGELGPGLLLVFEGSDAAGKGGAIKRLVEPLDPRHYRVTSFAKPSFDEKRHAFLWRFFPYIPGLGGLSLFDRSWYGRVLVERIEGFATTDEWNRAYEEIVSFERMTVDRGRDPRQVLAADQRRGAAAPVRGPRERPAAEVEDHRRGLAQPQEGRPVRRRRRGDVRAHRPPPRARGTSSRASRSATPASPCWRRSSSGSSRASSGGAGRCPSRSAGAVAPTAVRAARLAPAASWTV